MQREQVLEEQSNQTTFKTLRYLLKIVQGGDEKHLNWGTYSKYGEEDFFKKLLECKICMIL